MTRTPPTGKAAGKPPSDGGWFWMLDEIVLKAAEIGPAALAVYVVLAQHANGNRQCWPKVERIAALLGFSDRTVKRALRTLCKAGLVTRKRTSNGVDSGAYNVYTLSQGDTGVPLDGSQGDTGVQPRGHWCPAKGTNPTLFPGVDNISELNQRTKPKNKREKSATADEPPGKLLELIDGWNALPPGIVKPGNGARRDPPAKATLKGWAKAQKEPEQREAFADIPALLEALKRAKACHGQDWFSVPWLFGTNKNGEFNVVKVLNGQHDTPWSNSNGNGKPTPPGPGQRHPADANRGRGVF
jgi:hypothetical protein